MAEGESGAPRWLLRGERVWLRPVEADDVPLLHRWENDPATAGAFQAPRPRSLREMERRFGETPTISEEGGRLLVVRAEDGTPVGDVSFHRVRYGAYSPAMNIGIGVAPEHRGQGYGSEAQRLLADYLLAALPIGRVEAGTDVENIAEQRALERAGFTREGVARKASWRAGAWHDMVVYSRVQGDAETGTK
jgi:RimJ/RimL family protein N-acetyltransferase